MKAFCASLMRGYSSAYKIYPLNFTRCPNDAPVKERMLISSTKEALKKKLDGLQYVVQANDDDEVSFVEVVSAGSKGKAIYK